MPTEFIFGLLKNSITYCCNMISTIMKKKGREKMWRNYILKDLTVIDPSGRVMDTFLACITFWTLFIILIIWKNIDLKKYCFKWDYIVQCVRLSSTSFIFQSPCQFPSVWPWVSYLTLWISSWVKWWKEVLPSKVSVRIKWENIGKSLSTVLEGLQVLNSR